MTKARLAREVAVRVHNDIGVLAIIAKLIADKGVNMLAITAWTEGDNATVRMVTDDNLRAADALRAQRYNVREDDVVLVETDHKPGMLRKITERLAREGIDLHHLYASGSEHADTCLVVFRSAANDHALRLFPM